MTLGARGEVFGGKRRDKQKHSLHPQLDTLPAGGMRAHMRHVIYSFDSFRVSQYLSPKAKKLLDISAALGGIPL